jgi:hypothetical protein
MYRYFLIVVACAALLVGIQVPNFVDQYEQRLDAHFIEAATNLRGFQEIADRYFGGSLDALIEKHEASDDNVFRDEAKPIKEIYLRYLRFKAEKQALDTEHAGKVAHLLAYGDRELLSETYTNYSFAMLLNRTSVLSGLFIVTIVLLAIELIRLIGKLILGRRARLSV